MVTTHFPLRPAPGVWHARGVLAWQLIPPPPAAGPRFRCSSSPASRRSSRAASSISSAKAPSARTRWASRRCGFLSGISTPSAACSRTPRWPPSSWPSRPNKSACARAAWCCRCITPSAWPRNGPSWTTSHKAGSISPSPSVGIRTISSSHRRTSPNGNASRSRASSKSAGCGAARRWSSRMATAARRPSSCIPCQCRRS
jgi:hypothetical protein